VKGLRNEVSNLSQHLLRAQAIYDDARQYAEADRRKLEAQVQTLEGQK
jgi:hypothetical protein